MGRTLYDALGDFLAAAGYGHDDVDGLRVSRGHVQLKTKSGTKRLELTDPVVEKPKPAKKTAAKKA